MAKLIRVDEDVAEIEYFLSPAGPQTHVVRIPAHSLRKIQLPAQTRVFCFDPERLLWSVGRIDGGLVAAEALRASEDHYHVRFPNDEDDRIPISRLYVRWAHPIEDPTEYLASRITDTPYFFDGRSQIVRHFADQRASFGGLTGLASSAIELLEHQITTVRHILADPIQRYLLADEVGLGKTVEAGILVRQHLLDYPQAKVLVIVPRHLIEQWRLEFAEKFFLPPKTITIIAQDDVQNSLDISVEYTMLVIDEAHRSSLLAFNTEPKKREVYKLLSDLANGIPRVLLLSGTPVLHNEDGFLAMLHLLDPQAYPLSDREHFLTRVRGRQAIAESLADLSDDASAVFAGDAIQKLEELFSDDRRLQELCSPVLKHLFDDIGDESRIRAIRTLRIHLTETYRLHRRLLRTRRNDPRVQVHLAARTGVIVLEHEDHARAEAEDFIDAWREKASEAGADRPIYIPLFALFVEAALSHPRVLLRQINARLTLLKQTGGTSEVQSEAAALLKSPWAFPDEEEFLKERRALMRQSISEEPRLLELITYFGSNPDIRRAILFVDDPEVADCIYEKLNDSNIALTLFRFDGTPGRLAAFEQNNGRAILICDRTAEEGLNLQRWGAVVINYDLPFEPTRIEQRIGRVDRIEARGRMRIVAFCSGNGYERQWLSCLDQVINVFKRSVAPIQYVLVDSMLHLRASLLVEGHSAFEIETLRMRDPAVGLDAERRQIDAQEALDSVEIDVEKESIFFQTLEEADEAIEDEGQDALNAWVIHRLHFVSRRIDDQVFQYIYDVRRPTLVPLIEAIHDLSRCIDLENRSGHSKYTFPLKPSTFSRAIAGTKRVGLLRVGHPFLIALEEMVRTDDRGTAFAMWRQVAGEPAVPRLFFRFDFFIEGDLAPVLTKVEPVAHAVDAMRRRMDDHFPVQYTTICLDSDLDRVVDERLLQVLMLPYSKLGQANGHKDLNLRTELWEKVERLTTITDWPDLCHRARNRAFQFISKEANFEDQCRANAARLRVIASEIQNRLTSRIQRLSGAALQAEEKNASMEFEISKYLAEGIDKPRIRLDSIGAIFLSSKAL